MEIAHDRTRPAPGMRLPFLRTLGFCLLAAASWAGDCRLAGLFTDHAVLQRDRPIPIWGQADPGTVVEVAFAGQRKTATTDAQGRWTLALDPLPASSEARDLRCRPLGDAPAAEIVIRDILVGEVWLAAGQSNMHFRMARVADAAREIAAARCPHLRLFMVEDRFAQSPQTEVAGCWQASAPDTAASFSAVAYHTGRALQERLAVPVGVVVSAVGGTRIESWMAPSLLTGEASARTLINSWKDVTPAAFADIAKRYREYQQQRDGLPPGSPQPPRPRLRCHDCPSALHHGMIAPLVPYALRGALWYQGESNSDKPHAYERLLPALIADWRQRWGDEFPFLFVQLAPHQGTRPEFREAQWRIQERTPRTALVVTTDVGEAADIHPTRKRPVGERLARAARVLAYGEAIEASGPVFAALRVQGAEAWLSFTHAAGLAAAGGGALTGFTVAGADGVFRPATAVIRGDAVVVTHPAVSQPRQVRYAWANVPVANLVNGDGLPAVPFRTGP